MKNFLRKYLTFYSWSPPCFCYGHYKSGTAPRSSEKSRNLSDFSLIFHEIIASLAKKHHVFRRILPAFPLFPLDPSRICTVEWALSVNMYHSNPSRLAKANMEKLIFARFPKSSVTGQHFGSLWYCRQNNVVNPTWKMQKSAIFPMSSVTGLYSGFILINVKKQIIREGKGSISLFFAVLT